MNNYSIKLQKILRICIRSFVNSYPVSQYNVKINVKRKKKILVISS